MSGNGQGHAADSPRLASLRARVNQAEAALDASRSAVSDEEREERELRERLARLEDEQRNEDRARRALDLDRRFEEAQAAYPQARLAKLMVKNYPDTFIVKHDGKAFLRWQQEARARVTPHGKKGPPAEESTVNYAMAAVIDWNGITDWSPTNTNGHDLRQYLKANPGVATAVENAAYELAGSAADDSKS
jgi:hypothetical protein